jgi:hypothetical protein
MSLSKMIAVKSSKTIAVKGIDRENNSNTNNQTVVIVILTIKTTGTIDTTRTAKTGTSVTTETSTLMRVLTGKTSDDPAVDAMTTASSNHRMTSNQSRTVDVGAVAATLT